MAPREHVLATSSSARLGGKPVDRIWLVALVPVVRSGPAWPEVLPGHPSTPNSWRWHRALVARQVGLQPAGPRRPDGTVHGHFIKGLIIRDGGRGKTNRGLGPPEDPGRGWARLSGMRSGRPRVWEILHVAGHRSAPRGRAGSWREFHGRFRLNAINQLWNSCGGKLCAQAAVRAGVHRSQRYENGTSPGDRAPNAHGPVQARPGKTWPWNLGGTARARCGFLIHEYFLRESAFTTRSGRCSRGRRAEELWDTLPRKRHG